MKPSVKFSQELGTMLPPIEEIRNFAFGGIWKYIEATLNYRLNGCRDDLEDPRNSRDEDIHLKGRAEELRFLIDYPNFLIDNYDSLRDEMDKEIYKIKKEEENE